VVSLIARIYGDRYEGKQANKEGKKLGPRRIYKRRNGQRRRILSERSLRNVFLGDTGAPFQVSRTKFRTATRMMKMGAPNRNARCVISHKTVHALLWYHRCVCMCLTQSAVIFSLDRTLVVCIKWYFQSSLMGRMLANQKGKRAASSGGPP